MSDIKRSGRAVGKSPKPPIDPRIFASQQFVTKVVDKANREKEAEKKAAQGHGLESNSAWKRTRIRVSRTSAVAFVVLALSPWIYLAVAIPPAWYFRDSVGCILGSAFLYIPLAVVLSSSFAALTLRARLLLTASLATSLTVIVAKLLLMSPQYLIAPDTTATTGIVLSYKNQSMENATVSGLNVRYDPTLEKAEPGLLHQFRLQFPRRFGEDRCAPPYRFDDGYGNSVDFQQLDNSRVRLQDNLGGYAIIRWNGNQFELESSKSMGRSAAALGPTTTAVKLHSLGELLLILSPIMGWLLISIYFHIGIKEHPDSPATITISIVLQVVAITLLLWLVIGDPDPAGPGNEIPVGAMLILLVSLVFWGVGLLLLTKQMLKVGYIGG